MSSTATRVRSFLLFGIFVGWTIGVTWISLILLWPDLIIFPTSAWVGAALFSAASGFAMRGILERARDSVLVTLSLIGLPILIILPLWLWQTHPLRASLEIVALKRLSGDELVSEFSTLPDRPKSWIALPFFYMQGVWPRRFFDESVTYELPFLKGPPQNFVQKIVIHLSRKEPGGIQLTLYGPLTPPELTKHFSLPNLKACLTSADWPSHESLADCPVWRERLLSPFLQSRSDPVRTSWIEASGFSGVFFETTENRSTGIRVRETLIVVSPEGTTHRMTLSRGVSGQRNQRSHEVFEKLMQVLEVKGGVYVQRLWLAELLQEVRAENFATLLNSSDAQERASGLEKTLETQALLLAQISVDPTLVDPFFHLGGVSFQLLQFKKAFTAEEQAEWISMTSRLLESAAKYARTIGPDDPRVGQLEKMVKQNGP